MLCLSQTPIALSLVAFFLISTQLLFADLFNAVSANPRSSYPVVQRFPAPLLFTPTHISRVGLLPYSSSPPPGMCYMKADTHTCVAMPILSACHGSAARRDSIAVLWHGEV